MNELMAALERATQGDVEYEGHTVQELCARTGLNEGRVREALRRLQSAGRLTVVRVARARLDGARGLVPAYVIHPDAFVGQKKVRRAAKKGR